LSRLNIDPAPIGKKPSFHRKDAKTQRTSRTLCAFAVKMHGGFLKYHFRKRSIV